MIVLRPLAEAQVLLVGAGDLIDRISRNLKSCGVCNITHLEGVKQDPQELLQVDPNYFKSFDIVLAANQPRPFEVALSDLRWPKNCQHDDLDLPMIVMRNAANNVKMRCQYRELLVLEATLSKFVSLPMDLLPWTDEKRALVLFTVHDEFQLNQNLTFQAYIAAALAVISFKQSHGSWPNAQDREAVKSMVDYHRNDILPKIEDFIETFCEQGLAAAPETTMLLAHLVTVDAIKLLTGNGQPINNINLEDVIQTVATSSNSY